MAARTRGLDTPEPSDLDLGARHASSSRLGDLAARLSPGYSFDDLVLPDRQRDLLRSISAYLRHRDRVLSEWGYERTVARTQGLKVLFAGESGTGKTMAAQVLAAELGLDLFRVDLATVVSKYIGETEKNLERIFTRRRRLQRDPVLRRGRRAVRQALGGVGLPRPLRQHRGRLPAAAHGGLPRRGDPRHQLQAQHRRRVHPPPGLRRRLPVPGSRRPQEDLAARAPAGGAGRRRRRPRLPRDAVQALRRRDPQLLAGGRVPGRRRGRRDLDARTSCEPWRRSTASRGDSRSRPTSSASTSSSARREKVAAEPQGSAGYGLASA